MDKKRSKAKPKHIYEIDQSGKMENTARATILAASNGAQHVIILSARDKRRLQELFRRAGAPTLFVDTAFAVAVYILLFPLASNQSIFIIDIEYPGRTEIIEDIIRELFMPGKVQVQWKLIGKSSNAHDLAYKTSIKKGVYAKTKKIKLEEMWKLAKKGSKTLKKNLAAGRLSSSTLREGRRSATANKTNITHKRPKIK